jgi:hypothetical protein
MDKRRDWASSRASEDTSSVSHKPVLFKIQRYKKEATLNEDALKKQFAKMGARAVVRTQRHGDRGPYSVDIKRDKDGEYYDLFFDCEADLEVEVPNVRPSKRHLLLLVKNAGEREKHLCGHDERHWFVAAVPRRGVATVEDAMEVLKPGGASAQQAKSGIRKHEGRTRKNRAFLRQGEWFFIPADVKVDPLMILKNEPLIRGRGKPHMAEECMRFGGITVYVCREYPEGIAEAAYKLLLKRSPEKRNLFWQTRRRDPEVYVRGRISHPDHKTIDLGSTWHKVEPNRESDAPHAKDMVFLD